MTSQTEALAKIENHVRTDVPENISSLIFTAIDDLKLTFNPSLVIQPGTPFPAFTLPNALGAPVSLSNLLAAADRGVLVTFYRGGWCPYCNVALSFLQRRADDFRARGVTLIALSPELPDASLSTVEKQALRLEVLSDRGNDVARQLGLVWRQPEALGEVSRAMGVDQVARNGDDSRELPVAANLLIDKAGVVRNVHADPDWSKRLDPSTMLEWADAL
ncbi:Thioredoxin-like fold protein [Cordyceps fumosorosea ARSEF 2679]|uniref:thioredoxin-dependent peroxiredoxin n=1 Tax=Cordyceps fumosorosea (strain ARSEF 2679) TaxID=1081104 RepID=A0A168EN94_CORFA|nr:Thioredoxin-like fold protein [Cordyceps fumosorosea ARSEF 2679]OAA74018.1 Thioredoxin-like fold protein [Cordyceps fumosorosea ARSEF 2679]